MAADQFCLRWNNFQVNITSALESLKSDEDLVDVTLTCEGQNVKAHKVILSACSPYFRNVFKENPCQHPVVILKDVKYEDVTALLNFMYQGEVYITQDRLAPFLQTAEILQVRGLTGAASPFKDLQSPSPGPQSKPLQQQQPLVKAKKSLPQCGQMRRVTPPLPGAPSVPLMTPTKMHRAPRSPLISPPLKDISAASISKEKSKESLQVMLNRDAENDRTAMCSSPGSAGLQSPAHYCPASDQPGPSYSPLYTEQSVFSAPVSPSTFQQHSNDSSNQLLPVSFANADKVQSLSQPSSPPVAKRRKTFPRRVSSGQLLSEQNVLSDDIKDFPQESPETAESESLLKEVSVKTEGGDAELDNDRDEEEEYSQEPYEGDAEAEAFATPRTGEFDDQIEEESAAEEEMGSSGQNLLLRSLSGQPIGISQNDDGDVLQGRTSELNPVQPWAEIHDSFTETQFMRWERDESLRVVESENLIMSHSNNVDHTHNPLNSICLPSDGVEPYRQRNRMLYHRRKHSWQSRRPVQCPNCSKTISMAYNLKSHLASCLKRFGKNSGAL